MDPYGSTAIVIWSLYARCSFEGNHRSRMIGAGFYLSHPVHSPPQFFAMTFCQVMGKSRRYHLRKLKKKNRPQQKNLQADVADE